MNFSFRTAAALSEIDNSTIKVTVPASLPSGSYNVTCMMTGLIVSTSQATSRLTILDMSKITVQRISPTFTRAGSGNTLTIHGSGFVDTSELMCHYGDMKTSLKTTFVNSTRIECVLPKSLTKQSVDSDVFLSFADMDRAAKANQLKLKHSVSLDIPDIKTAYFRYIYLYILRIFGKARKQKTRKQEARGFNIKTGHIQFIFLQIPPNTHSFTVPI